MTEGYRLVVALYDDPIGFLDVLGNRTSFEFLETYLDDPKRPVLGQFFEEEPRGRWSQSQRIPPWFSNLLPEDGPLRDYLAAELEISPRSEVRLLHALGTDLPGAIAIYSAASDLTENKSVRFDHPVSDKPPRPIGGVRHSVAGVQMKLSMVRTGNTIRLAGAGEWGNCYVKFPGNTPRIPENEYFNMQLAGLAGLQVPRTWLVEGEELDPLPPGFDHLRTKKVYIVERFDRAGADLIHIEDFNQLVAGNWPEDKYTGASYDTLGETIQTLCGEDDFWEYLNRLVFNAYVGNEDAHLKNFSLIYPDRRNPRLAPLYDVVTTVNIPDLTRRMALKMTNRSKVAEISLEHYERLVNGVGLDGSETAGRIREFLSPIREHEASIRHLVQMSGTHWDSLDEYRRTVPILRPLFA